MVARLTPDQEAACSNHVEINHSSGITCVYLRESYLFVKAIVYYAEYLVEEAL